MDFSFSHPRPGAYNGSPSRPRPRSMLSFPIDYHSQDKDQVADQLHGASTKRAFSPVLQPVLPRWNHATQFGRASSTRDPITPAKEKEDPLLSPARSRESSPTTPSHVEKYSRLVQQGLLTPPDTPRSSILAEAEHVTVTASEPVDPFTPPATPGDWQPGLAVTTFDDEDDSSASTVLAPSKHRVRFASPTRSSSGETDFDDSTSTVSSFSEHGISRPVSPEPDLAKLSDFELWTRHYDERIPKRARLACAQCLRLGLPCDRSMPSCSRCTRRQQQHDDNALYSPTPGRGPSAIDSCCVPMLYTQDSERNTRPIPIFKAFGECVADVPWDVDLEAAKAALETRRRAAYDAIVAADEQRAARLNWVLPRAGAALEFSGRSVELRSDGCVMLKRTPGIDGQAKERMFAPPHPLRSPLAAGRAW